MSTAGAANPPIPHNEPIRGYTFGSPERATLEDSLARMSAERIEIPLIIGGEDIHTGKLRPAVMPHEKDHVLADVHQGGPREVGLAIQAAARAWPEWAAMPWPDRAAILLRAAELLSGPWRDRLNAATMLGQSKTVHQAEIDAACELCDFWRFNVAYAARMYAEQPCSAPGVWNRFDYRPLEGFIFAVTPFNFTSIAGNLPTAPALLGNTVVWKPASTAAFSAHVIMRLLQEAGLPDGVINLVHGSGAEIGEVALRHPDLAGIHFTGSTAVFQGMWQIVGAGIASYRNYPRIVGETGGKDFIVAHASADVDALAAATIRGAFEYQGQKCSAVSRLYVPSGLWPKLSERLIDNVSTIPMGPPTDFRNFMCAVIDAAAFATHRQAIEEARSSPTADVIAGGAADDTTGYFVQPTLIVTRDPADRLLRDELFGPILTIYVYPDHEYEATLKLIDATSPYALTGAVFGRDRRAILQATGALRHAAGNFYINDKPTGALVGQQPFGGARASGTNDKAGSLWNLIRWTSPRAIKETFEPPRDYRYPYMR